MQKQFNITGVVLAGGMSSRMGQDKSEMLFREQKLIEYSIKALEPFCSEIIISSNSAKHQHYNLKIIHDQHQHIGPIAGLYSSILHADQDYVLVLPCDSPLVHQDLIHLLINSIDAKSQAFIPSYQSFQEPLFAIYHKDILPVLERQIEAQNYKLMNLLQLIKTKIIKVDDNTSFANINAPEDFKNLEAYHKPI